MSVILNDQNLMTLVEANKRKGYLNDGMESFLANVTQKHSLLDCMPFYPASDGAFHKYKQAVTLGEGSWRSLNEGRKATRGSVQSFTAPVQLFSAESNVSEDILNVADDPIDTRQSEDLLVMEGLVNQFINTLVNGDGSDPEEMKGFEFFRSKLGTYCLDGKGTKSGSLTSIYLLEVGKDALNIRYNPKLTGGEGGIGLKTVDRGIIRVNDDKGNGMYVWNRTFDLTAGLELKKEKALVRVANIDPTADFDEGLFVDAMNLLPNAGRNAVAIVPRAIYSTVMKYALNKNNVHMSIAELENFGLIPKILGVPLLHEDSIAMNQKKYA